MVTIGSLRYDIVADTSKFTSGMVATRRELNAAQKLFMATRSPVEKFDLAVAGLDNALRKGAISQDTYNRSLAQLKQQTAIAEGGIRGIVAQVQQQGSVVGTAIKGFVAYRAAGFAAGQVKDSFNLAAELETTTASFATLTGSAANANSLVQQLRQYDAETTFGFADTTSAAKRLLNFGVETGNVITTLKQLGDISGGDAEKLQRLSLAFGQATSLGRLQREEVNQMVEAGFNPMNEIVAITGETMEELSDRMKKGGVAASELAQAIERATSEGGRFFGMVENRSKTTAGQIELLRGEWDMLKTDMATEVLLPTAKGGMGVLNFLREGFSKSREELAHLVMKQSGTAREVGGNEKANKILMDLASYDRRVAEAEAKKAARAQGQKELFASGKAVVGGLVSSGVSSVTGAASLLGKAFVNAGPALAGMGMDFINRGQQISTLRQQYMETFDKEKVGKIDPAQAVSRGSREEFQLRSQIARDREQNVQEDKRHREAQAKRDEIRAAINDLINLQPEPV